MGLRAWLWSKLDMPAYRAERDRRHLAWDYAQANDWATLNADPAKDRVVEAADLLDRDPDRAFFLLLTLAQQGSIWSMLNVGWCCEVGRGTPANPADAEHWYRRAYEAGCDRALIEYGRVLGRRGAIDLQQEVYATGAARGWAPAICRAAVFGLVRAQTLEARLELKPTLERAAQLGSPLAQFLLAKYMLGRAFGGRYVLAGLRLWFVIVKDRLEEMDAEDQAPHSPPLPASGSTLH